ncbi:MULTISPECIES: hypothetical protein [unclassified Achromobacter]|uniref:hypothetical protein n=1 Tax=unclassified Achromobacter TaxID=2626865 RepID=UPI001178BC0F|nr:MULTISPECIES: hypothetical protein [unclassified Achromobacter]
MLRDHAFIFLSLNDEVFVVMATPRAPGGPYFFADRTSRRVAPVTLFPFGKNRVIFFQPDNSLNDQAARRARCAVLSFIFFLET